MTLIRILHHRGELSLIFPWSTWKETTSERIPLISPACLRRVDSMLHMYYSGSLLWAAMGLILTLLFFLPLPTQGLFWPIWDNTPPLRHGSVITWQTISQFLWALRSGIPFWTASSTLPPPPTSCLSSRPLACSQEQPCDSTEMHSSNKSSRFHFCAFPTSLYQWHVISPPRGDVIFSHCKRSDTFSGFFPCRRARCNFSLWSAVPFSLGDTPRCILPLAIQRRR